MTIRIAVLLALGTLALAGAAPAAEAAPVVVCAPAAGGASACFTHDTYKGSLYCEQPYSYGSGHDNLQAKTPTGQNVWLHVSYWCFEWGGTHQTSSVVFYLTSGPATYGASFSGFYYPYWDQSACKPCHTQDCGLLYWAGTTWGYVDCPGTLPAPWGSLLAPLFQNYLSVNPDCTSGTAPTLQLCLRGNPKGLVALSSCDASRRVNVRLLNSQVTEPTSGSVACIVAKDLLG